MLAATGFGAPGTASLRFGGSIDVARALDADGERELDHLAAGFALVERSGAHFGQVGTLQPLRIAGHVAQQFGDALLRLGVAGDRNTLAFLLEAFQVDAFRGLLDQFIEQVDRLVAVALQVFDSLLARLQRFDLLLERGDLFDLFVQLEVGGGDTRLRSSWIEMRLAL